MKNTSILLLLAFVSCDGEAIVQKSSPYVTGTGAITTLDLQTVIVDSCEYLVRLPTSDAGLFTHKGNCKFCHERFEKMLEQRKNK